MPMKSAGRSAKPHTLKTSRSEIKRLARTKVIAPSLIVIPMSFNSSSELMFPPRGFSFRLYHEFFHGGDWLAATRQSFIVALGTMLIAVAAGVPAAYALARAEFPGKRLQRVFRIGSALRPAQV